MRRHDCRIRVLPRKQKPRCARKQHTVRALGATSSPTPPSSLLSAVERPNTDAVNDSSGTFPTAKQDPTWASSCESASLSRMGTRWSDGVPDGPKCSTSSGLAQTRQELQFVQLELHGQFSEDNLLTQLLSGDRRLPGSVRSANVVPPYQ